MKGDDWNVCKNVGGIDFKTMNRQAQQLLAQILARRLLHAIERG